MRFCYAYKGILGIKFWKDFYQIFNLFLEQYQIKSLMREFSQIHSKLKKCNWSALGVLRIKIEQLNKTQHADLEAQLQGMWSENNDEALHQVFKELR